MSLSEVNTKRVAFDIVTIYIEEVQESGLKSSPKLLLNISGAAGTGKSFWLNILRRYARVECGLPSNFVTFAASSGTAAFPIGCKTLDGVLYLPVGAALFRVLKECSENLGMLQLAFERVRFLVIDEKFKIGLNVLCQMSERLKEGRPQHADTPFRRLSIFLLGDWKQLPPVDDASLYYDLLTRKPQLHQSTHQTSTPKHAYVLFCSR